jgi:hypothetical protein
MFTVDDRNRIRGRLLEMARQDPRLVAGALVGSTARGSDRWSDLDLAFGFDESTSASDVLNDWTRRLEVEFRAVHLFDVSSRSSMYRVFLFPGNLQVDLSFTPKTDFGSRGPNFTLLFGTAVETDSTPPPTPDYLFGLAVHHLVRARICIERGRLWQAEYWMSAARDYALSLACYHRGLNTNFGRGFDELPPEILQEFTRTLVNSLDREILLQALRRTIEGLLGNAQVVRDLASRLEPGLRELGSSTMT